MQPDVNTTHVKTVASVTDGNKTFNKNNLLHRKWIVVFVDGYKAEVVKPDGEFPSEFVVGQKVHFRIGYRNNYADEINALAMAKDGAPRIISMAGHPAAIALNIAKDIGVVNGLGDPVTILEHAEHYYAWLMEKTE